MKINVLWAIPLALAFTACDDNTSTLGQEVMPEGDRVDIKVEEYNVTTQSVLADKLLAKTSTAYLGKYTDPYSQTTFESEFMAQFNCLEDFEFPETVKKEESNGKRIAKKIELRLYYSTYFGDSLNPQTVKVYPLTKRLEEDKDFYTDVNPAEYYDENSRPIVTKGYTAVDKSVKDSTRWTSGYYPNLLITLPTEYGTEMLQKYFMTDENGVDHIDQGKQNYSNAEAFIENVCKGFFFQHTQGDGTVLNIDQAHLNLYFDYYIESSSGKVDSLVTGVAQFSATPEVIQVNHFETKGLQQLIDDPECTYLQTPAGIFTEVTLPIDDLSPNDTINGAQLIMTRYNLNNEATYKMGTPQTLLMVPKADVNKFFEDNLVPDNRSYYTAAFSSSYNQYDFSNIASYINQLRSKKRNDPAYNQDPDWNKVVLIPVTLVTQSINGSNVVVGVRHDLQMNFAKLKGNKDKLQLKVIYSKFKDMI